MGECCQPPGCNGRDLRWCGGTCATPGHGPLRGLRTWAASTPSSRRPCPMEDRDNPPMALTRRRS